MRCIASAVELSGVARAVYEIDSPTDASEQENFWKLILL